MNLFIGSERRVCLVLADYGSQQKLVAGATKPFYLYFTARLNGTV